MKRYIIRWIGTTTLAAMVLFSGQHAASAAPKDQPTAAPAVWQRSDEQALSTLDLIEQAYRDGRIGADQRILYLAYALYEPQSLPKEFRSAEPWNLERARREFDQLLGAQPKSMATSAELDRVLALSDIICDQTADADSYETDHFRITYNQSELSPDRAVEDYGTILENVYQRFFVDYGWTAPLLHPNNTFGKYPVRITPLPEGTQAAVSEGGGFTGPAEDGTATCMLINPDMSAGIANAVVPLDELAVLQTTIAHELVHVYQRRYVPTGASYEFMWFESHATMMEDELYDQVNANYRGLWPQFTSELVGYNHTELVDHQSPSDYTNWLFLRYLSEQAGGANRAGGGEDVMEKFWQNARTSNGGKVGPTALNQALLTKGKQLNTIFHDYAITARFMLPCAAGNTRFCFEEAAGYLAVRAHPENIETIATVGGSYEGEIRDHYSINWVGLPTDSASYNVTLLNDSERGKLRMSIVARVGDILHITNMPALALPDEPNDMVSWNYTPPAGAEEIVAVITNEHQQAEEFVTNYEDFETAPYFLITGPRDPAAPGDAPPPPPNYSVALDVTSSMTDDIAEVKASLKIVADLLALIRSPKFHLVTFDDAPTYVGGTVDNQAFKAMIDAVSLTDGGECPEDALGALNKVAAEAPNGDAIIITDAGFHGTWADAARTAAKLRNANIRLSIINLTPNGCPGPNRLAEDQSDPVLGMIATQSGGYNLPVQPSEIGAAIQLAATAHAAPNRIATLVGAVQTASPQTYDLPIDASSATVEVSFAQLDGAVSATLLDPQGRPVSTSGNGVTITDLSQVRHYALSTPQPGLWRLQVSGEGAFSLNVGVGPEIGVTYLGSTTPAAGTAIPVRVRVAGSVTSPVFKAIGADGAVLAPLTLFDDGQHNDAAANDGVYGGQFAPSTDFRILMTGTNGAATVQRVDPKLIMPHQFTVSMAESTATSAEHDLSVSVEVVLDQPAGQPITVAYATADGTAQAGLDFQATSGVVTFRPGQIRRTITVPLIDDGFMENDEVFSVVLSQPAQAQLGTPAQIDITIASNDHLAFTLSSYRIKEYGGTVQLTVRLDTPSRHPVTVNYATQDGSAVAGSDYTAAQGTLTFVPGVTSQTLAIEVKNESSIEPLEDFRVVLSNPLGAGIATAAATVLIEPTTTARFQQSTFVVREFDQYATIHVSLSEPSERPISIAYSTANGSAIAGQDYESASGILNFPAYSTSQSFSIWITNDSVVEGDETIVLKLSNPVNVELPLPAQATLTIKAKDKATFSSATYTAQEESGSLLVTVKLSAPPPYGKVFLVNYATQDGTALAGSEYTATSGYVTFSAYPMGGGETSKTFTVPLLNDANSDSGKTFQVVLSTPVNADLGTPAQATVTINDAEPVPSTVAFAQASYTVEERAGQVQVKVRLNAPASQQVSVKYTTSDGTALGGAACSTNCGSVMIDYIKQSSTLTFEPGQVEKTITISIKQDTLGEATEYFYLTLSAPSNATLGTPSRIPVYITETPIMDQ